MSLKSPPTMKGYVNALIFFSLKKGSIEECNFFPMASLTKDISDKRYDITAHLALPKPYDAFIFFPFFPSVPYIFFNGSSKVRLYLDHI